MGEGLFESTEITQSLNLRVDSGDPRHGLVEPSAIMSFKEYSECLAATGPAWEIEEAVR
jgi:hypothetical protein